MAKHLINIGLNKVNPDVYDGWDGILTGCVNDSLLMQKLIKPDGMCLTLHNQHATFKNVVEGILTLGQNAKPTDKAFITFSCHGTQVEDINKDESDKLDEALCLYDGLLLDDVLGTLINTIKCNVYVFSDSCHSGTISKAAFFSILSKQKAMPKYVNQKIIPIHKILSKELLPNFNPNVLTFAACQDDQVSYDLGLNGAFTKAINDTLQNPKYKDVNYRELLTRVKSLLKGKQTPKLSYRNGKDIINEKTF